jgi:phosphomannomutase
MALILDLLAAEGQTVSQAVGGVRSYAMLKEKITCDSTLIASALSAVWERFSGGQINDLDGVRIDWPAERKWVHVRGSNTEPIMRIIAEATDREAANALMKRVQRVIEPLTS